MTAKEFVLHPSSSLQIAIQGRVIAQATSPSDDARLRGRGHSITIYETTQGELIASIEFHTASTFELDFGVVERSLSLEEISELLACQDPTEHIDQAHLRGQGLCESNRFMKAVYQDYDLLGLEIERQLQSFVPCERQMSIESAKQKSAWIGWNPFSSEQDL